MNNIVFIITFVLKQINKQSISGSARKIKNFRDKAVSSRQWEVERDYQLVYSRDADIVSSWARQSTQRSLLSYKIFPEPKDKSRFIFDEFADNFCDSLDALLSRVRGNESPTESEIERQLRKISRNTDISKDKKGGFNTQNKVEQSIIDAVCLEKAQVASFYVNNYDLAGYEFWKNYEYTGVDEGVNASWFWQLGYWVIEDVINSIAAANADSINVLDAPIKRLLTVDFTSTSSTMYSSRRSKTSRASEIEQNPPVYVMTEDQALAETFTNRLTNEQIDIVHFHISVLTSNKGVLAFMNSLCSAKTHSFSGFKGTQGPAKNKHNQITILESNLESIDLKNSDHQLYRYGTDEALFKMNLYCEYVFDKQAYDQIKPESIKKQMEKSDDSDNDRRSRY